MNPLDYSPSQQVKALYAALVAGLTGLIASLPDGLTSGEIAVIALAVIVAFGGVFGLSNSSS